jgi:signal transduction histidine kinase
MAEKPTYEELETRVKELEKTVVKETSAENIVQVSEREKETILNSLIEHVAYQDTEMKIQWANLSACKSANMMYKDIVGRHCYEIWGGRSECCPDCPVMKAMETCRPQAIERFAPDGRYWFIRGYPSSDATGNIVGGFTVVRDITHRNRREEQHIQVHKMESIRTLSGGIVHEFNNFLAIILGNAELAMDTISEENPAHFNIQEIQTAVVRAKNLVKQLIRFARKDDNNRTPVKINSIITEALKLLRYSISTNIEIRSDIPIKSETLIADPTQIKQAIINVCTNAVHAMEKEGGILEIKLESVILKETIARSYNLFPGGFIKLSISDTGHGIDPEIKQRIFDPYFTTKQFGLGFGMGLAIVHSIVRNHNGAISVDSEIGKGTTVNMFLPISKREPVKR